MYIIKKKTGLQGTEEAIGPLDQTLANIGKWWEGVTNHSAELVSHLRCSFLKKYIYIYIKIYFLKKIITKSQFPRTVHCWVPGTSQFLGRRHFQAGWPYFRESCKPCKPCKRNTDIQRLCGGRRRCFSIGRRRRIRTKRGRVSLRLVCVLRV